MNKIALITLLCSITYTLPHNTGAPVPIQFAAISALTSQQHPPLFLENGLRYWYYDGHNKSVRCASVTSHYTLIWDEKTLKYISTVPTPIKVSTGPILTP